MSDVNPNAPESEPPADAAPADAAPPPTAAQAETGEHHPLAEHEPQPEAAARAEEPAAEPAAAEPEVPAEEAAAPTAPAEPGAAEAGAAEAAPAVPAAPETNKKWYVVKVQSGREESIRAAVERKVKIEGLEEFFGQIAIPVEQVTEVKKVTEKKNGEKTTKEKRVVKDRKKFPGYIFAEVEFNDRILYLFRETSGVGDFVGATQHRAPTPMTEREVQAMLNNLPSKDPKGPKGGKIQVKLDFEKGDKVRIRDGAFANSEGEVKEITIPKDPGDTPKVTVVVTIWGRPVDVDLDYWQVDKV